MLEVEGLRITSVTSALKISRSGYYRRLNRSSEDKDITDFELIKIIFDQRKGRVGIRQIKMLLQRQFGITMNHKKSQG